MRLAGRGERLVSPLKDALRPDVDPRARRHLAEHRQPERLEPAELFPRRPSRHEQRVGDQHARRKGMRAEDADRFAALDEESLVVAQFEQRANDRPQGIRVARSLPGAAVDDELFGSLGDLRIEVVEKHPQRRFGRPRSSVQLASARCADPRRIAAERVDLRVERGRRAHSRSSCSLRNASARRRFRQDRQLHSVATM